jgi:hypothetical protein
MPKITLTVAEIKWPAEGKARGNIVTTDSRKFGCFREKFELFQVGGTYEVEITDGQYQNVVSAKMLSAATPTATQDFTSGAYRHSATGNGAVTPANHDHHDKDKQIFVCALLKEFIRAGKVELEERSLANAVNMLKRLHGYAFEANSGTFNNGAGRQQSTQQPSQNSGH